MNPLCAGVSLQKSAYAIDCFLFVSHLWTGAVGNALIEADRAQRSGSKDRITCTQAAREVYCATLYGFNTIDNDDSSRLSLGPSSVLFDVFSHVAVANEPHSTSSASLEAASLVSAVPCMRAPISFPQLQSESCGECDSSW